MPARSRIRTCGRPRHLYSRIGRRRLNSKHSRTRAIAAERLAGVLAAGFRLTVPRPLAPLPENLPLKYESPNAAFTIQYADASVDLKQQGPIGSFTTAERWHTIPPSSEEQAIYRGLLARFDDADDRVAEQASYFLSLLNDAPANEQHRGHEACSNPGTARRSRNRSQSSRSGGPDPSTTDREPFKKPHLSEQGPIDLEATRPDDPQHEAPVAAGVAR